MSIGGRCCWWIRCGARIGCCRRWRERRGEPPPIGEVVARLRRGSLRYRDGRADDPPPGAGFPIELLLWNLGMVLQPDDLLPQVKARGWVQLTRWPDFGRIRSNPAQLKMSALLTSRAVRRR